MKTALKITALLLWAGLAMVICSYAFTYVFYLLLGRDIISTPVWLTIINATIYVASFLLAITVHVKLFKQKYPTRKELGLAGLPTWADILLAPAGFLAYLLLAAVLLLIFKNLPFFDLDQTQELGYTLTSGLDRLVAFIALCIVAPIAEELIFRGWLYAKLRAKIPGQKLSLILSILLVSILFGLMHGQWNVGVNVFAMSVILCALREVTGTIYTGILLHILKNTVAFVLVYIVGLG